jgi:hypothetical protein
MEPRWHKSWLDRVHLRFLGGTNRVDLWLGATLRVAWGNRPVEWDWVRFDKCGERLTFDPYAPPGGPTPDDLEEALTYLRLFAPWVLEPRR